MLSLSESTILFRDNAKLVAVCWCYSCFQVPSQQNYLDFLSSGQLAIKLLPKIYNRQLTGLGEGAYLMIWLCNCTDVSLLPRGTLLFSGSFVGC